MRGRSSGGQSRGDLFPDVTRLAHARHDHAARRVEDHFCSLGEIVTNRLGQNG